MLALITQNPLFTGGAGLMGIGVVLSFARRFSLVSTEFLKRRFISRLELDNTDPAFQWVLDFINKNSKKRAHQLSVSTQTNQTESGKTTTSFIFTPGRGTHFLVYKNRWVQVSRDRQKHSIQRDDMTRTAMETVCLTTLGADPTFWRNFLENAARDALSKVETGLSIYIPYGQSWHRFGNPKKKRPLDSVILDSGVKETLQADIDGFLSAQKWYTDRGIPYRRGYLFYGPPGTGKTSFISALAAHHGYNICMLTLSDRTIDDARLNHLMNNAPPNSFLLLEDIDNAFVNREALGNEQLRAYEGLNRVTMSGLLNAVDGVASSEERILFMTTNYVDRLDSALIRPGRVDVKRFFGNCSPAMLRQMFHRFYDGMSEELCIEFAKKVAATGKEYSPASIQGHLLNHKESPELAIQNENELVSSRQTTNIGGRGAKNDDF